MAENYIVSARKYRPQTFDTVVGQEHITTTLKNAIRNNHLAHAYLFCGPRGVGKTTNARILAKTINCENPTPEMEACDTCQSCLSFRNNASFNIFELDAASNNSVEDIRELVNQVRFAPQQGKYKIYIIDEVHMLSSAAFNAFLKTLEEPPSYAIFILATTEKHKILPTILSRCQIFDFKRITTEDIVSHLQQIATKEGVQADEAALHVIAQKSEGCMRDALSMLDRIASFTGGRLTYQSTMEHLNMLDADFYFRLTDFLLAQDVTSTLLQFDEVLERGFEGNVVLEGLAEHFRNLLLCKDPRMAKLLDVPNDHKRVYHEKALQAPPSFILSALNILNEAELNYRTANNKRLHVEMCLIRLCYLLQVNSAAEVKKKLRQQQNSLTAVGKPATASLIQPKPVPQESAVQNTGGSQQVTPPVQKEPVETKQPLPIAVQQSVPEIPPATVKTPQPSAKMPPPGGARKVSKNLLGDIDEAINQAAQASEDQKKELKPDIVEELYRQYIEEHLKANNRGFMAAQFAAMRLEVDGEEIRIVAPTELIEEAAKEQRNLLIDYFRKHTGIMVRVTTEIRKDPAAEDEAPIVLSKTEIFESMAGKNPDLYRFKEALNLQIEY